MTRPVLAIAALACLGLAGFAQQPATEPETTMQNHPAAGHSIVPKPGDDWPKPKADDIASIDAIVNAYYASTSGAPGEARDWNRFKSLFHPAAHLIPARPSGDGGAGAFFLTVDDYIQQNTKYFTKMGFVDKGIAQRVDAYGNIAQVWSTYESRKGKDPSAPPYARGIASIQLLKDGGRWWIVSIFWDYERTDAPIPEKYLQTPKQ